jgi:hypothetical protein
MLNGEDELDISGWGIDAALEVIRKRFPGAPGLDDDFNARVSVREAIAAAAPHMACEHDGQAWDGLIAERDQLRARVRTLQRAINGDHTATDKLSPELRKQLDDIAADCDQPDLVDWVQGAIADAVLIARHGSPDDPNTEEADGN